MAKIIRSGGHDFEIPDDAYTGTKLQELGNVDRDAVPVIRRGDKDIPVEPDEVVTIEPGDRIVYTTPMEAA